MTEFWFIRHGESESNAGLPSESDQSTPLTERGFLQADLVARHLTTPPDLFVVSPYLRAIQTARPTIDNFPETPVQTWQIQEFSYLSHEQYNNTTSKQRGVLSRNYFKQADPDLVLGEGGESFHQFIERIESTLETLHDSSEKFIILFGHGWFMRATLWYLYKNQSEKKQFKTTIQEKMPSLPWVFGMFSLFERLNAKKIFAFLLFSASVQIPNGSILKFRTTDSKRIDLLDFDLSHLPEELKEITWINR
jgi:broad specificity phosphatase PhoE